ncbi:MAG TPA: hydrogenase maturation protease [Kofleriaceae bacterium]|nr:hydrogenase maturation protease [Kofleriaceae bacterium]
MIARVVALGQRTAGDDGVGPAILDRVRALAPPGVELVELVEASGLIPLLGSPLPLVILDAVVTDDRSPGGVVELDAVDLPPRTRALSTHGIDLPQAIALGRTLAPGGTCTVRLVGVVIDPPDHPTAELSPPVAAAIPRAVTAVLALLRP